MTSKRHTVTKEVEGGFNSVTTAFSVVANRLFNEKRCQQIHLPTVDISTRKIVYDSLDLKLLAVL